MIAMYRVAPCNEANSMILANWPKFETTRKQKMMKMEERARREEVILANFILINEY